MNTFETAIAATVRGLAGVDELEVLFDGEGGRESGDGKVVTLGPAVAYLQRRELAVYRAVADSAAFRVRYHSGETHERMRPEEGVKALCFDIAERARWEGLGAIRFPGVMANLRERWEREVSGVVLGDGEISARVLSVLVFDAIAPNPACDALSNSVEVLKGKLTELEWKGVRGLVGLAEDQVAFGEAVLGFLETWSGRGFEARGEELEEDLCTEATLPSVVGIEAGEGEEDAGEFEMDSGEMESSRESERSGSESAGLSVGYRVFDSQYDEVIVPQALVSAAELSRLRRELDERFREERLQVSRLANRLRRRLMALRSSSWTFDVEAGLLDSRRLARVVAEPNYRRPYKEEQWELRTDTVVSILVDNSASMRGNSIALAAICSDILSQTFEYCGVEVEVLGYTTQAKQSEMLYRKWEYAGRPPVPGRLSALRHIVYKAAGTPWRRARDNFGLMLKAEVLGENIDGEAIEWASQRLLRYRDKRRILVVVSDGLPMDKATASLNGREYLNGHLHAVLDGLDSRKEVEVYAIGIGQNLSRFYGNSVAVYDANDLGSALIDQFTGLFG